MTGRSRTKPPVTGPQWAALCRLPGSDGAFAPRPRWTHGTTIATLLAMGLIERDAAGRDLYRRTAAGDAAVAAVVDEAKRGTTDA
jgi:hypothetical protein